MVVGEITGRQTRTVGGFKAIHYPPSAPARWSYGREDVIEVESGSVLPWVPVVAERLHELMQVPDGWEQRGTRPVQFVDVKAALTFLASAMNTSSPIPGIVALPTGGLELHWRVGDEDLEVIFDSAEDEQIALLEVGEEEYELTPEQATACVAFLGESPVLTA
jgi:hypothetical protein